MKLHPEIENRIYNMEDYLKPDELRDFVVWCLNIERKYLFENSEPCGPGCIDPGIFIANRIDIEKK